MLLVPGQMIISVALAIVFTANVPLSFSLIFIESAHHARDLLRGLQAGRMGFG